MNDRRTGNRFVRKNCSFCGLRKELARDENACPGCLAEMAAADKVFQAMQSELTDKRCVECGDRLPRSKRFVCPKCVYKDQSGKWEVDDGELTYFQEPWAAHGAAEMRRAKVPGESAQPHPFSLTVVPRAGQSTKAAMPGGSVYESWDEFEVPTTARGRSA